MVALAWLYGPIAPMPAVHADLVADRAVDHAPSPPPSWWCCRAPDTPAGRHRQDDREVLRPGAGHDGVHRHLLDRVLPVLAEVRRAHVADDLVRLAAGVRPASPRRALRSAGRSAACRSSGSPGTAGAGSSSVSGSTSRGVVRSKTTFSRSSASNGRVRPSIDLLHDRPAGDRVVAVDVGAQLARASCP